MNILLIGAGGSSFGPARFSYEKVDANSKDEIQQR